MQSLIYKSSCRIHFILIYVFSYIKCSYKNAMLKSEYDVASGQTFNLDLVFYTGSTNPESLTSVTQFQFRDFQNRQIGRNGFRWKTFFKCPRTEER